MAREHDVADEAEQRIRGLVRVPAAADRDLRVRRPSHHGVDVGELERQAAVLGFSGPFVTCEVVSWSLPISRCSREQLLDGFVFLSSSTFCWLDQWKVTGKTA
jgi:hypothetical protein